MKLYTYSRERYAGEIEILRMQAAEQGRRIADKNRDLSELLDHESKYKAELQKYKIQLAEIEAQMAKLRTDYIKLDDLKDEVAT